jgi:cytochrome c-type biogenesis protein CcmH/NrfF
LDRRGGARVRRAAAVAAALALALAAAPAAAVTQRTSLVAIEQQVMCVTCGIPLQEADSVAAQQEKAYIQRLVSDGDSASEIRARLVAQYGVAVLALPPDRGFNVAFYLVPIAAVLLALAIVALLLPRWRRNRSASPAAGAASLSASDSTRLDADLARFDD